MKLSFKPLTPETWKDFEKLFGEKGACAGCWCMYWLIRRKEYDEKRKDGKTKNEMKKIVKNGTVEAPKVLLTPLNPETVTADEIRARVAEAGIVGQGGAAFPTSVKLSPPKDKIIDVVILNGCECEPYLTRDYRFMIECPDDLISGFKLIMKALGVKRGVIGMVTTYALLMFLFSKKEKLSSYPEIVFVSSPG